MTCARLILDAARAALPASPAFGRDGNHLRVIDGGTVAPGAAHIRRAGVDAPEQGMIAKDRPAFLRRGQDGESARTGLNRYGRKLGTLTIAGRTAGAILIGEGIAICREPGPAARAARLRYGYGRAR